MMKAADAGRFAQREADWRAGPVVYQVFVDRFAGGTPVEQKRDRYDPPRRIRNWSEVPEPGRPLPDLGLWSHELDFWGGDLKGLRTKLPYIDQVGASVLYLNPIHSSITNHKYDPQDYFTVAPEYGTREDLKSLVSEAHRRRMRVVLDGVFNHVGRTSAWFQDALTNNQSPYRDWFFIGPEYRKGYRAWSNVGNLPELRLENERVQDKLWGRPESVVQSYLKDGIDGWRLDTAHELGPELLDRLTRAAHRAKPGSLVVGEVWNYPEGWAPPMDGVMNFHARQIILDAVRGAVSGPGAGRMIDSMVRDVGIEPLLRSWLILDNHDTDRLKTALPEESRRRAATVLQFTLPGAPGIYYGSELGMEGGGDPANRAPMLWDAANDSNPELQWIRKLTALRKSARALRIGDFRLLDSDRLLAFQRTTERYSDSVYVLANLTENPVREGVSLRDGRMMSGARLRDSLSEAQLSISSGRVEAEVPPMTVRVLKPVAPRGPEYTPFKRVR